MTNGQIVKLQELSKCHCLPHRMGEWVDYKLLGAEVGASMDSFDKTWLRRLTHQYRHQIAAIKRNQTRESRA